MNYNRILLIRTDRIGDVLLTTPAIEAVRKKFPLAHIACVVQPYAKDIVDGNPFIDEVIVYDKNSQHKSLLASFLFAAELRKKAFEVSVIFHPTNRAHLIACLAAIPRRIGYARNLSFLLTDKIPHKKHLGQIHETECSFDLLKPLGISSVQEKTLYMPIKQESENSMDALFITEGLKDDDEIAVFHPGASCYSKMWPAVNFAKVADTLSENFGLKAVIVGSDKKKDMAAADMMKKSMKAKAVQFCGKLTISELASCLKRARILISNDSGPVHISCAVKTPSVVIFGRAQAGLSPRRWGPTGKADVILHKDIGCGQECLAHNCRKGFMCLKAISADEVYEAAAEVLKKGDGSPPSL
ncbi:MAG: glycosyltransferase family 9 protein [Candidatus Omnitrophota bacterium]